MAAVTSGRVNPNRYRITFTLLGVALAAVVVAAVVLAPSGRVTELPEAVERISPVDGSTVLRQTQLEVDMRVGYGIELFVDGVRIPFDEIRFTESTGTHVWRPGPGLTFETWRPGAHAILIRWDRVVGLPDPGELRWSFRVQ